MYVLVRTICPDAIDDGAELLEDLGLSERQLCVLLPTIERDDHVLDLVETGQLPLEYISRLVSPHRPIGVHHQFDPLGAPRCGGTG